MKHEAVQSARNVLFAVVLFGLVSAAYGATLRVANNGVDGAGCGPAASPCRSITQAIANAVANDTILVGPGLYGDLDADGTPGETGEETPNFGAMLMILKPVIILSTDGAAATVIDARFVSEFVNVGIQTTDGVEFGRPDHGFLVTNTLNGWGIYISATNVKVRGNQVQGAGGAFSAGIFAVNNPSEIVLIEQNQVIGWTDGIVVHDAGKKVSKNQVSLNGVGIRAAGGSVVGNVATANGEGIILTGAASAVGNATYGNTNGFAVFSFTGVIQKNNIFGNRDCGLRNFDVAGLVATNNYWGSATGPGPDPADAACGSGTTMTTPSAKVRFLINPSFEP